MAYLFENFSIFYRMKNILGIYPRLLFEVHMALLVFQNSPISAFIVGPSRCDEQSQFVFQNVGLRLSYADVHVDGAWSPGLTAATK